MNALAVLRGLTPKAISDETKNIKQRIFDFSQYHESQVSETRRMKQLIAFNSGKRYEAR